MKRLLLITLLFTGLLAKGQQYPQYMDANGQLHTSTVQFSSLALSAVPFTFTINGTSYDLSTNPVVTISSTIPPITILSKSSNYTVLAADFGNAKVLLVQVDCTGGNVTISVPTYSTISGYQIQMVKTDATTNTATLSGISTDNVVNIQNSLKSEIAGASGYIQN